MTLTLISTSVCQVIVPAQYPERFVRYFARLLVRANKIVVLFHMKCKFPTSGVSFQLTSAAAPRMPASFWKRAETNRVKGQ